MNLLSLFLLIRKCKWNYLELQRERNYPRKFTFLLTTFLFLCRYTVNGTNCQFPTHWTGSWFQKGFRDPVYIKNGSLSSRGVCRKVEGEKFLIESKSESCFRCIVIHERHKNVLQFKETYCSSNSDLEQKCREISGDAPLYSMFRLNTTPTACPFNDSFTFSYSRGYGECSNPISTVDSCSNQSQLFFKFQACADVRNSESREEKLTCYGTWKEGSTWYLVAKLEHKGTITEEDKFRCFVYDKLKNESGYQVAQSGDATCDGLFSATEGSRTMTLIRSERFSGAKCHFPHWFMKFSHWQSLDGSKLFTTDRRLKSFYLSNTSREGDSIRLACNRMSKQQDSLYEMAVQVTSGCMFGNRGYRCMRIHQRTKHVIEVQMGNQVLHASEACSEEVFNSADERYVTLTTKDPRKVGCPVVGEYTMIESKPQFAELVASGLDDRACVERSFLSAACDEHEQLEFRTQCPSENKVKSFQCHGSWKENGTHFVIASVPETRRRYCMAFTEDDHVLYVSSSPQTCVRTVNLDSLGQGVFSVTNKGGCRETDGARDTKQLLRHVLVALVVVCALNLILTDDSSLCR